MNPAEPSSPNPNKRRRLNHLEHKAHRAAHQLRAAPDAKRLPQLRCVIIRKGHQCVLPEEWAISLTEDHADGPPTGGPPRLPQPPPLGGTLPFRTRPTRAGGARNAARICKTPYFGA